MKRLTTGMEMGDWLSARPILPEGKVIILKITSKGCEMKTYIESELLCDLLKPAPGGAYSTNTHTQLRIAIMDALEENRVWEEVTVKDFLDRFPTVESFAKTPQVGDKSLVMMRHRIRNIGCPWE